jgi:hypothetical protein
MNADDRPVGVAVDDLCDGADRCRHPIDVIGDQARQRPRRSMSAMERHRSEDLLGIIGGDLGATSAVHVKVDEAWQDIAPVKIMQYTVTCRWITGSDAHDPPAFDTDPPRFQHTPERHNTSVRKNNHQPPNAVRSASRFSPAPGLSVLESPPDKRSMAGQGCAPGRSPNSRRSRVRPGRRAVSQNALG